MPPSAKDGKHLEGLVAWIERALRSREGAVVTANDHIRDRDTGEERQVDVSIRVPSGHDSWLGIVEVRDRNRPIDARYVEEVSGKRESVGADVAYIVSKAGFYSSALKKAERQCIRLLTLDEAADHDWSAWCQLREFLVLDPMYDNANFMLAKEGSDETISIHEDVIAEVGRDQRALVLLDSLGRPLTTFRDLGEAIVNHLLKQIYADVPTDGSVRRKGVILRGPFADDLHIRSATGLERIGAVRIDADFWYRVQRYPVRLHRYRKAGSDGKTVVEVMESVVELGDKTVRMEMLAETDGKSIGGGRALMLRHTVLPADAGTTLPASAKPSRKRRAKSASL